MKQWLKILLIVLGILFAIGIIVVAVNAYLIFQKISSQYSQFPSQNSNVSGYPSNSGQNIQPSSGLGIPASDPNAENLQIYFTDFKHSRIVRMDDMTGKNLISFGTNGTGFGQFITPEKFLVQPDGRIYIADPNGNDIIRIDDMTGKGWVSYGTQGFEAAGPGHFNQPHSIRLDSGGKIYIADGNCRIVRIDDMTGKGWTEYGSDPQCSPQTSSPAGNPFDIAFDSQGRIYIIDGYHLSSMGPGIIRIDDMTGKNRIAYGTYGTGVGQFLEPQGIHIDTQDRIYVTDEDKTTQGGRIIRIDDMTGKGWVEFSGLDNSSANQAPSLTNGITFTNEDFKRIYSSKLIGLPHDVYISKSGKIYIANTHQNGIVRIDDMTGKGWIAYNPYTITETNGPKTEFEAPKGIFLLEK